MSADLFAEFNDLSSPTSPPKQQQQSSGAGFHAQPPSASQDPFDFFQTAKPSGHAPPSHATQPWPALQDQPSSLGNWGAPPNPMTTPSNARGAADDDDGWGDFEVAEPTVSSPAASQPSPWQAPAAKPSPVASAAAQDPGQPRLVRASTLDIISNSLVDIGGYSSTTSKVAREEPKAPASRPKMKPPSNPNVLFDAQEFELECGEEDDDDYDEDEFGDFETVAPTAPKAKPEPAPKSAPPPSMDLLSLDEPSAPAPSAPAPTQPVTKPQESKSSVPLSFGATTTKVREPSTASKPSVATKPSESVQGIIAEEDEWAAWDDFEPPADKKKSVAQPAQPSDSWDWGSVATTAHSKPAVPEARDDDPPPINVPPPSVVLSAFPTLLGTGNALFKPMAGQNASIKQRVLSDPKAMEFLRSYILIATTAARVIAGRKHRWHRDKILAKSMSISAAGSKGMKLAGVDKTQSAREDREAADVAAVWREQVGKLRSAVAAANAAGKASLRVPEISENMHVQTAKLVPTAPKPCIICGLKRDERVAKVDYDVEDSFGEWWVEHWGHRACKNFWVQHEQMLRQR